MNTRLIPIWSRPHALAQSGVVSVELALVMVFAFLPLLLGILEVGRLFYVANMAQEVTRRAARAQVVRWESEMPAIRREAVLQCGDRNQLTRVSLDCRTTAATVNLPGSPEISQSKVNLAFFHSYADARDGLSPISGIASPQENLNTCLLDSSDTRCIHYVRATLQGVSYSPMVGLFGTLFRIPLPGATVIMPAESLGLL